MSKDFGPTEIKDFEELHSKVTHENLHDELVRLKTDTGKNSQAIHELIMLNKAEAQESKRYRTEINATLGEIRAGLNRANSAIISLLNKHIA